MPTSFTLPAGALLRRIGLPIGFFLFAVVLLSALPVLDYYFFATAARAWRVDPLSLYTPAAPQFFYAPWALLLLVPLSWLPNQLGNAVFGVTSLSALLAGCWVLLGAPDRRAFMIGASIPFTAALVLLSQWDGLVVGGVGLAWYAIVQRRPWLLGVALAIIGTKPTNALIIAVVLLVGLIRLRWSPAMIGRVLVVPLLCVLGAFVACGLDWPVRYLAHLQADPPRGANISFWLAPGAPWLPAGVALGALIGLVRVPFGRYQLAAALVAGLIISPFVVPYHFVGTAPALALIAYHHLPVGITLWVVALAGLIAFALGGSAFVLLAYLIIVMIAIVLLGRRTDHSSPR